MLLPTKTLIALLPYFLQAVNAGASGNGKTTRYWDCCKPSCAWSGKATLAAGSSPVTTCDIHDNPLTDLNAASGCSGGTAFQCSNESPWAVNDDLAYGYAAVKIDGGSETSWCCACYELTFTSGPVAGKKMVVQATNTGADLAGNQFDISMPGGGVGVFNGCTAEWGAPSSGWGAQYGGVDDRSACDSFPKALQAGCYWRFDWFQGASNPDVSFEQVACPAALTKNTGCIRADESSEKAAAGGGGGGGAAASSLASSPAAAQPATSSSAASSSFLTQTAPSPSLAYVPPVAASSPSTPSASPGILPQIPSAGESSTTTVATTTTVEPSASSRSAYLQVVTVTIDACGM